MTTADVLFSDNKTTVSTDGGEFAQFYLDPPAPSSAAGAVAAGPYFEMGHK